MFLTFRSVPFGPDPCSITFYQFFYENTCADSFLCPLNAAFTMIFVQCTQHLSYLARLKYSQSVESQMCLALIVKCTNGLQISVELFVCLVLLLHCLYASAEYYNVLKQELLLPRCSGSLISLNSHEEMIILRECLGRLNIPLILKGWRWHEFSIISENMNQIQWRAILVIEAKLRSNLAIETILQNLI
ncbi:Hypothetical_protein [Hexamita inflata]|uniref:Hypothetical_protein n=1 Tax=Hexamita inflata TaxID=28002 RepID=A0AA86RIX9_9EUKA|nr:Hypothetical protein HINF_LOCUS66576 [Hexamita inflata]